MTDSQLRLMIRILELELLRRWHERARQERNDSVLTERREDEG